MTAEAVSLYVAMPAVGEEHVTLVINGLSVAALCLLSSRTIEEMKVPRRGEDA